MIINYLRKLFGETNIKTKNYSLDNLPLYMKTYKYEYLAIFNKEFMFMKSDDNNLNAYKNHSLLIKKKFNCEAVLVLNNSKEVQRNNLIDNGLMFIEEDKYIFMPSVGLVFLAKAIEEDNRNIRLSPQDVLVSLAFFYSNKDNLTIHDINRFYKANKMAVSRATRKLEALKMLKRITSHKTYYFDLAMSKKDYLEKLLAVMDSPVKETRLINKKDLPSSSRLSGVSAISENSMLNDDDIMTYAIDENEYEKIKKMTKEYVEGLIVKDDEVKLEIWNHNPSFYAKNKSAELISVIKSLFIDDERLDKAVKSVKEQLISGKYFKRKK